MSASALRDLEAARLAVLEDLVQGRGVHPREIPEDLGVRPPFLQRLHMSGPVLSSGRVFVDKPSKVTEEFYGSELP